jgi:hypothetical protein
MAQQTARTPKIYGYNEQGKPIYRNPNIIPRKQNTISGKYFAKKPLSNNPYLNGTYKPRNKPGTTNSNNVPLNYRNIKSLSIPNNEDLQPIKVTNPKKANWWSKQTKNNKILIASVGLITVASIIYFMTKKKK